MIFWFWAKFLISTLLEESKKKLGKKRPQTPDCPAPRPGPFVPAGVLLLERGTSSSTSYVNARGKPPTWLPRGKLVEEERRTLEAPYPTIRIGEGAKHSSRKKIEKTRKSIRQI